METMRATIENIGGRRFALTVGCGAVCSVLLWFGKLTDPSFTLIIMGTVGAYIAANTTQKIKAPGSDRSES